MMPFKGYERWEEQYFTGISTSDNLIIPVQDFVAWELYPSYRSFYNKMYICELQGLDYGPHGTFPPSFPVFSKPIYNLWGMGIGSRQINDFKTYVHNYNAGHFWMPVLEGEHWSIDVALIRGRAQWMGYLKGISKGDGRFDYWEINGSEPSVKLLREVSLFLFRYFPTFTGMVNVETIGNYIIEIHLRLSAQFVDLFGEGYLENVVKLYESGQWDFDKRAKGYSVPLWTYPGEIAKTGYITAEIRDEIVNMEGVKSLQDIANVNDAQSWEWMANPPESFRVAVVNSTTLDAGRAACSELARMLGLRVKP